MLNENCSIQQKQKINTKKLVNDLSGKVAISNLNNAITFLEDNGIDTAGDIL